MANAAATVAPAAAPAPAAPVAEAEPVAPAYSVPVEYRTLDNGLKVIGELNSSVQVTTLPLKLTVRWWILFSDLTDFHHTFFRFVSSMCLGNYLLHI